MYQIWRNIINWFLRTLITPIRPHVKDSIWLTWGKLETFLRTPKVNNFFKYTIIMKNYRKICYKYWPADRPTDRRHATAYRAVYLKRPPVCVWWGGGGGFNFQTEPILYGTHINQHVIYSSNPINVNWGGGGYLCSIRGYQRFRIGRSLAHI